MSVRDDPKGLAAAAREESHLSGTELIAQERARQVALEGYDAAHDDEHTTGQLAAAAAAYAYPGDLSTRDGRRVHKWLLWPWRDGFKHHGGRVRELVKAGALIAAEIDRLQRKEALGLLPTGRPER